MIKPKQTFNNKSNYLFTNKCQHKELGVAARLHEPGHLEKS